MSEGRGVMSESAARAAAVAERLTSLAVSVLRLTNMSVRTPAARYVLNQLVRSACSAGANYQESRGAESRADFVHKMQIVLKELRETLYWLTLIERGKLLPTASVHGIATETNELVSIFVRAVVTTKARRDTTDV
jgi:four helix bundle protein